MKKSIIALGSIVIGTAMGAYVAGKSRNKVLREAKSISDKYFSLFRMMNHWVNIKQEGKNLADWLEENGYKKIAIYGMSDVGLTLYDELLGTKVRVAYGIDQNAGKIYSGLDVDVVGMNIVSMESSLEKVDAIIVTAVTFFDEIEEKLSKKISCPVVSLVKILNEI